MRCLLYIWVLFLIIFPHTVLAGEWELQKSNIILESGHGIDNVSIEKVELHGIYFIDENTGWAVGYHNSTHPTPSYGIIFKTTNGGKDWKDISPRTHLPEGVLSEYYYYVSEKFYRVYFVDENNGWVLGTHGVIIYTSDGGNSWKKIYYDDTKWGVWKDICMYKDGSAYKGFLVGGEYKDYNYDYKDVDKGYIHKGYVYAYTHYSDDTIELVDTKIFDGKYKHFTSLNSGVIDSQRIFCLTGYNYEGKNSINNYGIVYRFNDSLVKKDISPKKVGFTNKPWSYACYQDVEIRNNYIWVIGTDSTIIFSEDSGSKWRKQKYEINSGKNNKIFFVNNNNGWVVGTSGGIYTTSNGGESWNKDNISSHYSKVDFEETYFPSFKVGWIIGNNGTILKYTQSVETYLIKDKIFAYPNPFIPDDGQEATGDYTKGITIENLSPGSTVKIYTISGNLVKETSKADAYGIAKWKVDESLASGLYLLIGKDSGNNIVKNKVVIIK
ncbi:MAG: YCF48-related protein [bacterium]|nr:YCF48-related protein [bacterium]